MVIERGMSLKESSWPRRPPSCLRREVVVAVFVDLGLLLGVEPTTALSLVAFLQAVAVHALAFGCLLRFRSRNLVLIVCRPVAS